MWLLFAGCSGLVQETPEAEPNGAVIPVESSTVVTNVIPTPEHVPEIPPTADGLSVPVSGGGVLVLSDGVTAAAADISGGRLLFIDIPSTTVVHTVELGVGTRPFRLAETGDGAVLVTLSGTGELATLDPVSGVLEAREFVCDAPRGVAWEPATDLRLVVCAGGEWVGLDAQGGVRQQNRFTADLRDVVVDSKGDRWVSWFRSANVGRISMVGDLEEVVEQDLPDFQINDGSGLIVKASAQVAWRMLPHPDGGVILLEQMHHDSPLGTLVSPSGVYYAVDDDSTQCAAVVGSLFAHVDEDGVSWSPNLANVALPVDVFLSGDGSARVAAAGASPSTNWPFSVVSFNPTFSHPDLLRVGCEVGVADVITGSPMVVGVAQAASGAVVSVAQDPFWIFVDGVAMTDVEASTLPSEGNRLFHENAGLSISCASCHPEGSDDGHTWYFFDMSTPRRTQNLRIGGVSATAPYHWTGEFLEFPALAEDAFVARMGMLTIPTDGDLNALLDWLDGLPVVRRTVVDEAAVERGEVLFAKHACAGCHAGELFTNPVLADVGTGHELQVPSLVGVGTRGPWMHDGCATTLQERFNPTCGGAAHLGPGIPEEIEDLVAFLDSL